MFRSRFADLENSPTAADSVAYALSMVPQKDAPGEEKDGRKEGSVTERSTSEFLLRACHDLRTFLRSIRAHAELLLKSRKRRPTPT